MSLQTDEADRAALVARIKAGSGKYLLSELGLRLAPEAFARVVYLLGQAEEKDELVINFDPADPEDAIIVAVGP
ncbi:MAG: hypothetical protein KGI38_12020 [Thaumarchaeota archaeon]|nr:hypothetical protein [Nitrososphaerota archaeon]